MNDEFADAEPRPRAVAPDQRPSRRSFLKGAAVGAGAGLAIGATGAVVGNDLAHQASSTSTPASNEVVPFYGPHQAGIETAPAAHLRFVAYDLTSASVDDLAGLLRSWTAAAVTMTTGRSVADDSGETVGLPANALTLTFGFGPGLFDDRFGLAPYRPSGFGQLPAFATDRLEPALSGGDLMVQACANDPVTAFHAIRQLDRDTRGVASIRWQQAGFGPAGLDHRIDTPRNLLGFKDGTANPAPNTAAFASTVWVPSTQGPAWLTGGTYLCVRRIRTDLSRWDQLTVADQQVVIGRTKTTGGPLSGGTESSPLRFDATGPGGTPAIPLDSHVRLASDVYNRGATMLRRGYSYDNGINPVSHAPDVGLLFLAYVRDITKQFVPIQQQLARHDRLNQFITHIGSATFAIPPGITSGGHIGASLLAPVAR